MVNSNMKNQGKMNISEVTSKMAAMSYLTPASKSSCSSSCDSTMTLKLPENLSSDTEICDFANPEDFENMVGDLRRTFIGWLKKTEKELRREKDTLKQRKKQFEEEKTNLIRQIQFEKQSEYDKINEDRKKGENEIKLQIKQVQIEREDARRKINEEMTKFEKEKENQRRKLLLDRDKLDQEYELFDAEKRRINDCNIATQTMVVLNVGGSIFETSRHTLIQQTGSFLESLLSGRHHVQRDRQGRIFLDRDSMLFRILLNFLRDPSVPPIAKDLSESDAIIREAEFYGIKFYPFPLVFACGGHSGLEYLRAVEVLDMQQKCWKLCKMMQTERAYFGGAVLHNKLYIYGGQNVDYKALCDSEVYDILLDQWVTAAPLIMPRRNTCGITLNGKLYTIGGFDGSNILSSVESYDPRMRNWMDVAPLKTPRSSAMCCIYKDRILVLGGTTGERLRTVETYDPRMDRWEAHMNMIEVRSAGCACGDGSKIFAIGGTDNTHAIHSSVEVFDSHLSRWMFAPNMSDARMDFSSIVVSDSIMVGGGQNGEILNSTEFFKFDSSEWIPGPNMLFPRYGHCYLLSNL